MDCACAPTLGTPTFPAHVFTFFLVSYKVR